MMFLDWPVWSYSFTVTCLFKEKNKKKVFFEEAVLDVTFFFFIFYLLIGAL